METGMTKQFKEVSLTEFKTNMNKYIVMSSREDIYLTSYGRIVAKLTAPFQDRRKLAESLFGIVPETVSEEEAKEERLNRI